MKILCGEMNFVLLFLTLFSRIIYNVASDLTPLSWDVNSTTLEARPYRETKNVRTTLFMNGTCYHEEFQCADNKLCISKNKLCNGVIDCSDGSDEYYCYSYYHECPEKYFSCSSFGYQFAKCIPVSWKCDGVRHCYNGLDELSCNFTLTSPDDVTAGYISWAKIRAKEWLLRQSNNKTLFLQWSTDMSSSYAVSLQQQIDAKKAVSLFLSSRNAYTEHLKIFQDLAFDLKARFLPELSLKSLKDVRTSDLASYLNAFLVTCVNPRKFYVANIVEELRKRVDVMSSISPFAVLTLCNAQEKIKIPDIKKLLDLLEKSDHKYGKTDIQAMIMMTLTCVGKQEGMTRMIHRAKEVSDILIRNHARNGTVENLKTTAITLQALFAYDETADEKLFDERKAIYQILQSQEADGSFGGIMETSYVLPVLSGLSLIDISSSHCHELERNDTETLTHLTNQVGDKIRVKYSLLIGESKTLQRTLTLNVKQNESFWKIMEYASGIEDHYKFKYNLHDWKPYVYYLAGFMNDPETELFWKLYQETKEEKMELKHLDKSPADIIPEDKDHFVYWYRNDP